MHRRDVLRSIGVCGVSLLAGCGSDQDGSGTDRPGDGSGGRVETASSTPTSSPTPTETPTPSGPKRLPAGTEEVTIWEGYVDGGVRIYDIDTGYERIGDAVGSDEASHYRVAMEISNLSEEGIEITRDWFSLLAGGQEFEPDPEFGAAVDYALTGVIPAHSEAWGMIGFETLDIDDAELRIEPDGHLARARPHVLVLPPT